MARMPPRFIVRATAALKEHPMWSRSDFEYLRGKGWSNEQVLAFWNRDLRLGCQPVQWDPANPKYQGYRSRIVRK